MTKETTKKYTEAVGRRKTAVARVRLFEASKNDFTINEKELNLYFPTNELQTRVKEALSAANIPAKFKVSAKITGGGVHSQAEALRHGIARALVKIDEGLRKTIKKEGFLKRDPRVKERKKFGLKKARKSPQWSKR